ncbi:diphthine methyl ester synthase [Macrosteles quadrilineatus]|uniref:diphthine methyl ester synthase n=1 Tax=Macrosteles quadrilineatus TaxID=74068 RepID=UPI0023E2610E|nr:diphthine methyl ester synthase [Macrosteles quadrilineatus]
MFYIIGLGLGDPQDITVKGLSIVKNAERVYLEVYTSILAAGRGNLEEFYGRELLPADRELVEQGSEEILKDASTKDIVFLVVGDPFSATTHTDLFLRAKQSGIPCQVIHNASIINAIGCTGLQLYNFGETVSIPYWTDSWQPDSFYSKICSNKSRGLHTLCLLDIRVKEPTVESLMKKKREYEPPRFMSVSEAAIQLLQIISSRGSGDDISEMTEMTECVGVARVGAPDQRICYGPLRSFPDLDLGAPLHSLVIVGTLHPLEQEFLFNVAETIT